MSANAQRPARAVVRPQRRIGWIAGACLVAAMVAHAADEPAPASDGARWYQGRRMYDRRIELHPSTPALPVLPKPEDREPIRRPELDSPASVPSTLFRPSPSVPAPTVPVRRPAEADRDEEEGSWLLAPILREEEERDVLTETLSGWGWLAEQVIVNGRREEGEEDEEARGEAADEAGALLYGIIFGDPPEDSPVSVSVPDSMYMEAAMLLHGPGRDESEIEADRAAAQAASLRRSDADIDRPRESSSVRRMQDQPGDRRRAMTPDAPDPVPERANGWQGLRGEGLPRLADREDGNRVSEGMRGFRDHLPSADRHLAAPLDPTVRSWRQEPSRAMPSREGWDAGRISRSEPALERAAPPVWQVPGDTATRMPDPFSRREGFGSAAAAPAGGSDPLSGWGNRGLYGPSDPQDVDVSPRIREDRNSGLPQEPAFRW